MCGDDAHDLVQLVVADYAFGHLPFHIALTNTQVAKNRTTSAPAATNVPPIMDANKPRIRRQTTVVARL